MWYDPKHIAKAFIKNSAKSLLNENTSFLLKGPEFGLDGIKRTETIVTGKYIELVFSEGTNFKDTFLVDAGKDNKNGLNIIFESDALGSLSQGKPIYYRQVKVGEITGHELNNTLDKVLIYGTIYSKYSKIISKDAKFWYTGGISAKISLSGISVESNTIESILKGGIEFAVPEETTKEKVESNHVFNLYQEPEKKWLEWIYD